MIDSYDQCYQKLRNIAKIRELKTKQSENKKKIEKYIFNIVCSIYFNKNAVAKAQNNIKLALARE